VPTFCLTLTGLMLHALRRVRGEEQDRDRGDVPGWVLITIMTAGIVTVLWALAQEQLSNIFTEAIDAVAGP
jgi:hypothetical protein